MVIPIANLSAVVTGAVHAAMGYAIEMLPTDVTRDAVLEAARASEAWFLRHLWAWLVAARAVAVENLPEAAASAVESSWPWLQMPAKIFHGLCRWLLAASGMAVEKLPDADAMDTIRGGGGGAEFMSEASSYSSSLPNLAWFLHGHGAAVHVLLALALLAVVFLCGAVWALTCRTMKGPGLGGARIPRAMFNASPRRYYATVRTARKARRGASGGEWKLFVAAPIVAYVAYLATKTLH